MNSQSFWHLGEVPFVPLSGAKRFSMYFGNTFQDSVVFIGYADNLKKSGISCIGTGFLIAFNSVGYLVTARHVAEILSDDPFLVRLNAQGGETSNLVAGDQVPWVFHPDKTVDVAATVFESPASFQSPYIHQSMILTDEKIKEYDISVGCICYVTGLFRFVEGTNRNHPMTYTGNIASLQLNEPYPILNSDGKAQLSRVYMIQNHGVKGLSGSPVFARQTCVMTYPKTGGGTRRGLVAQTELDLLGIFSGAWFFPPDAVVQDTYKTKGGDDVPIGLGMVVPAQRIWELLSMEEFKPLQHERAAQGAAKETSVVSTKPTAVFPTPLADFNHPPNVASKTPPSKD